MLKQLPQLMGCGLVIVVPDKLIIGSVYLILQIESHEISTSQVESTISEIDSAIVAKPSIQSVPSISFSEAQRLISLFFALCTKVSLCILHAKLSS